MTICSLDSFFNLEMDKKNIERESSLFCSYFGNAYTMRAVGGHINEFSESMLNWETDMNVCLISDFAQETRLREFREAILVWHPDCRFVNETGKPDVFYVDMWQPEYADYAAKHYRKPTYLIGYSAIKGNPKVFRKEYTND